MYFLMAALKDYTIFKRRKLVPVRIYARIPYTVARVGQMVSIVN